MATKSGTLIDKNGDTFYPVTDASNVANLHQIPSGGTTGQVLAKTSGTNYAVSWVTPSSGGITGTGVTAIVAIEESDYAALTTKSATTLYIVIPDSE